MSLLFDIFSAANSCRENRTKSIKWIPIFVLSISLCMAAMGIKSVMVSGADMLGGRETVKLFYRANLVRLIISLVVFVGFLAFFIISNKDGKKSLGQLLCAAACGIIIAFSIAAALIAMINISGELKQPKTVEPNGYTLCMDYSGKYYVAFDDNGGVLLEIPADKYYELGTGRVSNNGAGFAYDTVSTSSLYKDVQYYTSGISIRYYDRSVIYENVEFTESR